MNSVVKSNGKRQIIEMEALPYSFNKIDGMRVTSMHEVDLCFVLCMLLFIN